MSTLFHLEDVRELIRQFSPEQSQEEGAENAFLISTIPETYLLRSTWIREEFRRICKDSRERIGLEKLSSRFDIAQTQCMATLQSELEHCLLSSDKKFIIPEDEQDSILDELKTISNRIGVSMKRFAHGNDINVHQMRDLVDKVNHAESSANRQFYLEILEDGDSLISREAHEKYMTGIQVIISAAQNQAITQELDLHSDFQDLKLSNNVTLLLAKQALAQKDQSVNGWLQDRGQENALFTPNSHIVQALQIGKLRYVNLMEPVSRPYGGPLLIKKSSASLRAQMVEDQNAHVINTTDMLSSSWIQDVACQVDSDLSTIGVARVSFTDIPSHVRSAAMNLLVCSSQDSSEATGVKHTLRTPCINFGDLLVSEKWRHDLVSQLEDFARKSAINQVESGTREPSFDVAQALDKHLKSRDGLTSVDRNELRQWLQDRNLNNRVKSAFDAELTREYSARKETFRFQYCDRVLYKADLAREFIQSVQEYADLAKVLEETLGTWIQETLIPLNFKPQSPLSKLAQQCNDKALDRKLDALQTQWRGIEDLRSFPPQYQIAELADDAEARGKAKEGLIRKQREYLARETRPLDGLLELIVILLARRAPGFAHVRGKHIPRLIGLLDSLCRNNADGTLPENTLGTLNELKNQVKAGNATGPELDQMRDIERRDAAHVSS